ncbi:dolichol-phosphate mannosyltransferase [Serinibacter arcticus]|uniref:Dolichol-phosphate mannosyltransferase n=1 Tax=Serinibacter arcticus TaxID=1655435 RepID=A0A2U1ZUA8_9MICO|nr:polyprenol monophosphomannose synthase [Serinibacter arcticus]PWD50512.1 dolichol-phosphate mannosyltransferase [Serinibacter arcticus]
MTATRPEVQRPVVVVPTYDEIENLPVLLERLHAAAPQAHVLIVDDGSPDGTGVLAQERADELPWVHVLHRTSKDGLAAAYLAGFAWALARDYDAVMEMDADLSHHPEDVPRLLAALTSADVVLGSRWVPGGGVENWPLHRRVLSRGGSFVARIALEMSLRDATGGFRAYRRDAMTRLDLASVASRGYVFQIELAHRALDAGLVVTEVPIVFTERVHGVSKMSGGIVRESLTRLTWWGAERRLSRLAVAARRRGDRGPSRAAQAS